jgi:hypothetical protein
MGTVQRKKGDAHGLRLVGKSNDTKQFRIHFTVRERGARGSCMINRRPKISEKENRQVNKFSAIP